MDECFCFIQDENAELYLVGRNSARLAEVQKDAQAFGDAAVHIIEVLPIQDTSQYLSFNIFIVELTVSRQLTTASD